MAEVRKLGDWLKDSGEALTEGQSFVLLGNPDFNKATDALTTSSRDPWEIVYTEDDSSISARYVMVEAMQKIENNDDDIQRLIVSGKKFPFMEQIHAYFELDIPVDDRGIGHFSFVTFFESET